MRHGRDEPDGFDGTVCTVPRRRWGVGGGRGYGMKPAITVSASLGRTCYEFNFLWEVQPRPPQARLIH